jgi:hypothetical protein
MKQKIKLFISILPKSKDDFALAKEENQIKDKIAKLLHDEGYKFIIYDDDVVDKDRFNFCKSCKYEFESKCPNIHRENAVKNNDGSFAMGYCAWKELK